MAANATFEYDLIKASKVKEKAQERGENDFNVFGALNQYALKSISEVLHSDFIAYLLNPNAKHNQKLFLKEFLAKLQKENLPNKFFENATNAKFAIVEREKRTKKNRYIDIFISLNDEKFIIIENKRKIDATDQDLQTKDYVFDTQTDSTPHENILFIYLHPDTEKDEPDENSLGDWKIEGNEIQNKNGEMQSYYFKMDYFWIREWLEVCVYRLCKEQRECGKSGFGKIIFGVEQYIELLTNEPEILDERVESNAVLEFIMQNEEYQKTALEIMRNDEQKFDKNLREIVENSWVEISGEILENFYKKVIAKTENGAVKIKNGRKDEIWVAERSEKDITTQGGHIAFYKEKDYHKEINCCLNIGYRFDGKDLVKPYFTMWWHWWGADGETAKKFKQIVEYWEKNFFPSLGRTNEWRVFGSKGYYYKYMLESTESKGQEKFAFLNWIFSFENLDKAASEFIKEFKKFAECEPIARTRAQVDEYIAKSI